MTLRKKVRRYRKELTGFILGIALSAVIIGGYMTVERSMMAVPFQSNGVTISWLPKSVRHYERQINETAKKYAIDANLVAIIMTLESGGYSKADSGQANGLMQITPYTAQDIAAKYLHTPVKKYDLEHPETNIEFGVAYLAHLRNVFCDYKDGPSWDGCIELVAAGYNGGPGAANSLFKGEGLTDTQTVIYSRNAFNMWRERSAKTSPTYDRWLEAGGASLVEKAQS